MRALVVVVLVAATTAHAEPSEPWATGVSQDVQDRARKVFQEGLELYKDQMLLPAVDKYRDALALWDHPMIRLSLAIALSDLDRYLEGADEIDRALRYGEAPFSKADYTRALEIQKLIAGRVGDVEATCTQPAVHVVLDGKPWFDCPGTNKQRVLVGPHVVVGQLESFVTNAQRVFAMTGEPVKVAVELVSLEKAVKLEYPRPRWLPWTIAGAGAAVGFSGLALWVSGNSQMDRFRRQLATTCPEGCDLSTDAYRGLRDERDSAELRGDIGLALEIVGGAGAITGVVLGLTNRPRRVLPPVEVAPTTGGATAAVRFHF
jgi:hypothetical protein